MPKPSHASPVPSLAHKFRSQAATVAEAAANLVAEFHQLRSVARDLQQAAPDPNLDELYGTDRALNEFVATEFQRLGAPWTTRHPLGNHTIEPMVKRTGAIADAVLKKAA